MRKKYPREFFTVLIFIILQMFMEMKLYDLFYLILNNEVNIHRIVE